MGRLSVLPVAWLQSGILHWIMLRKQKLQSRQPIQEPLIEGLLHLLDEPRPNIRHFLDMESAHMQPAEESFERTVSDGKERARLFSSFFVGYQLFNRNNFSSGA